MRYKLPGRKSPFLWHLSEKTYESLHKKIFSKDKYIFIKGPPSLLDELIPWITICSLNLVYSVTDRASYHERAIMKTLDDQERNEVLNRLDEQNEVQDRLDNRIPVKVSVCSKSILILIPMKRRAVQNSPMKIPAKKDFSISVLSIFIPVFTFILMSTPVPIPRHTPTDTAILMGLWTLPYLLLTKGSGL